VILSDDAGRFIVGQHALCWVHAQRLIHKPDAFSHRKHRKKEPIRSRLWWLYGDLKAYRENPTRSSLRRQCRLLSLSRSVLYYTPVGESAENLALMKLIDRQFLEMPWCGSRQMACWLRRRGHAAGGIACRG